MAINNFEITENALEFLESRNMLYENLFDMQEKIKSQFKRNVSSFVLGQVFSSRLKFEKQKQLEFLRRFFGENYTFEDLEKDDFEKNAEYGFKRTHLAYLDAVKYSRGGHVSKDIYSMVFPDRIHGSLKKK